jgi:uncharacterized protein (DUF302 family)
MVTPENGIETIPSNHTVDETVRRLQSILETKGIKVFAVVDHSGEAATAGLTMRPTRLLIFGNPRAGTPVMVASPSAALDLPLKILVAEDENGRVWVSYNSPSYLRTRHGIPEQVVPNLAAVSAVAESAAQ